MKKEKIFDSVFLTVVLFLFQIYFGVIPGWEKLTSDFPNYYVSAKVLSEHKDLSVLYDNILFKEKIKEYGINAGGQFALYPPPNALILLPFASFSPLTAKRIWLAINIFLVFLTGFLIKKLTGWNFVQAINTLLITGFALANDLFLGQVYLFCTVLLLSGYLFLMRNKTFFLSLSWGMAMALKYLPVIFLPVLLLKKKWKMLAGIIAVFFFIHLFCIPFFGPVEYVRFFKNIFASHIQGNLLEGNPYSIQYQSWESFLNNLFVYDVQFNQHPVFNFQAGYPVFKFIIYAGVILILTRFYFIARKNKSFFEIIISLSVISLLILEPGSATYHNLFLLLPFIIILKILTDTNQAEHKFYFSALFFLIGFLPALLNKLALFNSGNLFLSYNRLWLEMIFYFYSVLLLYLFN
ncbi:MAG TPA: glycosyltransferase family 87 protein, partial [Bacteroidia bacterium]|nr:glycosyltransferase family 87 protein [Bacteroidia bacterium]